MWHIIAFDLPVDDKPKQKIYRLFRKKLIEAGYIPLQKSLYCRWFDSSEKARSSQKDFFDSPPKNGNLFAISVPDETSSNSVHITDNAILQDSSPPKPWMIF